MLEEYFCNPRTLHELRLGPLGELMDDLSERLKTAKYPRGTARVHLRNVAHFSRYLLWKGVTRLTDVKLSDVDDFMKNHLPVCNCLRSSRCDHVTMPATMGHLHRRLVELGVFHEDVKAIAPDSVDGVIMRFQKYLLDIRAVGEKTVDNYTRMTRHILSARLAQHGSLELDKLTEAEVTVIHGLVSTLHESMDWKSSSASVLRMFLRFLHWEHITESTLGYSIKPIKRWRMSELPKALTPDQLKALLATPDRHTATGKRDYAILMLLATVGMRASEVAVVRISDFHWRKRTVTVPAFKTRREHEMPLTDEAFDAVYDYIRNARQNDAGPYLFLRSRAPVREFASSAAVTTIVTQLVCRSGIQRETYRGPHTLRHTFASLLVNNGASIKQISDMLGHRQIGTTQIYAKIDLSTLRKVTNAFPKCKWR